MCTFYRTNKFQLLINAKAASVFGVQFPSPLLAGGDEVIE